MTALVQGARPARPIGTFSLVLHTHLPWVSHHGTWPVGEEWLHQAFTGSWRRVIRVLENLGAHGFNDVLTLGITPVVADPYSLSEIHSWTARWLLRAEEHHGRSDLAALMAHERREAAACLEDVESRWLTGGLSSVLRPLIDANVIELIGGPATHPFQPLLNDRFASAQLRTGLDDAGLRFGTPPGGIWAPECGYAPGMEHFYQAHGVSHFLVDGPAVRDRTAFGYHVGETDVVCFARDMPVSYRIWSSRTGYPGGSAYRDFHTFDHASGFRPSRVTGTHIPSESKRPWDPRAASAAVLRDARDFVASVVGRLTELRDQHGREALVVAAFDTELFGHWWYEGPEFLDTILRLLPQAGVRVTSLRGARAAGLVEGSIELPASSWGAGKDWSVWNNEQVADLVESADEVQKRFLTLLDTRFDSEPGAGRSAVADQLAREAFLLTSSDWAFMVTRDSAAEYARHRARTHSHRFHSLADLVEAGDVQGAEKLAAELRVIDGPFGHLDARAF
jgi:1,4-alpha-glucan branching enzyme